MVKIGPLEFTMQTFEGEEIANRHKQLPEPGRCADRIEDFFKVLAGGWNNSWEQHQTAFSTMVECLKSDPGDEPRSKYVLLPRDDPCWKDHEARPSKFERLRALERQQQQQQEEAGQQQLSSLPTQQQQTQRQQGRGQPAPQQQQQQPQPPQRGYSWLWWWKRTPHPLAAAAAAAADGGSG